MPPVPTEQLIAQARQGDARSLQLLLESAQPLAQQLAQRQLDEAGAGGRNAVDVADSACQQARRLMDSFTGSTEDEWIAWIGDLVRHVVTNPDGLRGTGSALLRVGFDVRRADINRSNASTLDRVDGQDLSWLAYAYGAAEGAPTYSPDADLNGDGFVDGEDLALLSPGFGKCWSGTAWTVGACP